MLFGDQQYDNIPEEVIEILIDNGIATSQWEQIGKLMKVRDNFGANLSASNKAMRALQALGMTGSAAFTLWKTWYSLENKRGRENMAWGHMTEKERKRLRQEQLAKEAEELKKSGEVEVNAEGLIVGNKRDVEGKPKAASLPKEPATTQPVPEPEQPLPEPDVDEENWFEGLFPPGESQDDLLDMDMDGGGRGEPDAEMAAARAGEGGASGVSKETPISQYPSLSYGLQETHTTILPWTGWLSGTGVGKTVPLQLRMRMNAPWDIADTTTITTPAAGSVPAELGFVAKPLGVRGEVSGSAYPEEFGSNDSTAVERPAWRDYWSALYEYYTVLGCEWEVIITNPLHLHQVVKVEAAAAITGPPAVGAIPAIYIPVKTDADLVCGVQYDSYSDTATSTGNVMPQTRYSEVRAFKNIKWYKIKDSGSTTVISGRYKPGMVQRNIVNDGDVKTWTKTGAALPNLKDILTLNFWADPLANSVGQIGANNGGILTGQSYGFNMEIKLKYIVQFKDLKLQARYPNTLITGQGITNVLDETIVQAAGVGSAHQRWT